MLEGMFYYEGNLEDLVQEKAEYKLIDARDGYKNNLNAMQKVLRSTVSHLVLTNQVALLNNKFVWNKEKHEPVVYLKDKSDGKWKIIGRFTKLDLKYTHDLEKLYRNGEFDREKAFREKAERKPRDIFKFRMEES